MLPCPFCQAENPATNKFCGGCGGRLSPTCPACGHANPSGSKFCGECGAALGAAAPAAAQAPAPASGESTPASTRPSAIRREAPATYTPRHLAEKILGSRAAFEGERKQVTVLFSDVSGFTAIAERLDPEDVHGIMDRVFEVILDAVHRYEGTVNQFLGDGVMALFGAPISHEDHPHRALRAALAIQDDLSLLKREFRQQHGVKFRVRMGINTGSVVVGAIGRDLRMDYTAVGDTTNLAARLLGIAGPGQIVVSLVTRGLTEGYFEFEDLGEFTVKGKSEPVHTFHVVREIRGRTRLEVSRERGLSPLVGREREIEELMAAYHRADAGQATVLVLTGEPGVGKSRLLYEWLRHLEGARFRELEASCFAHTRSIPYYPISELVRRHLGLPEGAAEGDVRRRVEELPGSRGLRDEAAILLAHFLGASAPPEFLARLSGAQLKERTFNALGELLLQSSADEPVVAIVENLHWLDASSEEFLRYLVTGLPGHRVLLLLSTRPGPTPAWLDVPFAVTIVLEGLESGHVQHMIRTLLGIGAVSAELLKVLVAKGEGNPLYVEEILRQLRETGGIVVEGGEARLRETEVRVPGTIHDIIAARIDRLADPLKQTLQVAAVVGREFPVPLLSRALEVNGALVGRLRDLQALDFVFPTRDEPEPAYSFKHALTQEVAYSSLLERRRRQYHATVAQALEELYAGRTDEVVELLAYQFGRSPEDERAVDYAILAAEKAQRRWANTEALAYFAAAVTRLDGMDDTEANRVRRIDAVVKQAEIMFALGRHIEQVRALEAIRDIVDSTADPPRRAAWYFWTGFLHSLTGARPEISIAYCREALAIADASGLDEIRAYAECCLTHVYSISGDLRDGLAAGERALAMFEARGNVWWICRALWGLMSVANGLGEWQKSLEYCRRALELGQAVNDLRLKVVGWWRTASTHVQRGDPEAGLRCCEEALKLSPIPFDAAMIRAVKGYGLVKAGDIDAGTAELGEALAWLDQSHLGHFHWLYGFWLVEAHLRRGDLARARVMVEEILATSREESRRAEGVGERLLGEALAADDPVAAAGHLETAMRILGEIDARNELAKALGSRGELYRVAGDAGRARALLERALAIFDELGTLDESVHARVALAVLRVAEVGQGLLVVSRDRSALYERLVREFAGNGNIRVVLDRRQIERRQPGPAPGAERRDADRRLGSDVAAEIRSTGYAIVTELLSP